MRETDTQKVPRAFVERLTDAMCYTAKWLKSSSRTLVNRGKKEGRAPEVGSQPSHLPLVSEVPRRGLLRSPGPERHFAPSPPTTCAIPARRCSSRKARTRSACRNCSATAASLSRWIATRTGYHRWASRPPPLWSECSPPTRGRARPPYGSGISNHEFSVVASPLESVAFMLK